ncbi:MAG TPA: ATP-binding protein, partial [Candidatus Nitrosocosmicus sp.]
LLLESDNSKGKDNAFLVQADKARLSQVIINLLDNAIKFTKKNGTIIIRIETIEDGSYILVTVKDNGIGIDSDIISKLFSKFVTKSFQGTGLGLFISKSIVEAHGGRIWAKNNNSDDEREGATFAFTLPLHNQLPQQS